MTAVLVNQRSPRAIQGATAAVASIEKPTVPLVVGICEILPTLKTSAARVVHWMEDELWVWSAPRSGRPALEYLEGWKVFTYYVWMIEILFLVASLTRWILTGICRNRHHTCYDTTPCPRSLKVLVDTICLAADLHQMWTNGNFALRPLDYNKDRIPRGPRRR
jgi:hypothetical protein